MRHLSATLPLLLACCAPGAAALRLLTPVGAPPGRSLAHRAAVGPSATLRAHGCPRARVVQLVAKPPAGAHPLRTQFDLFWRLAVPYFERSPGAREQFAILFVLMLCSSGVSVLFSYVGRDFWSTLSAKDVDLFYEVTVKFAAALVVATPLTVLYRYQRQRLSLLWREWMTTELAAQYYSDNNYYKLELDPEIDNPDQRIAEDVRAFTRVSLEFFVTLGTSVIDLVAFSGILYSIYPNLFFAIFA